MATLQATNIVIIDDALITAKGSIFELVIGESLFQELFFSATNSTITIIDRRNNTEDPTEPVSIVLPGSRLEYTIGQRVVKFGDAGISVRFVNDTNSGGNPSTLSLLPAEGESIGGNSTWSLLNKGYDALLTCNGTASGGSANIGWIPHFASFGSYNPEGGGGPEYKETVLSLKIP